MSDEITTLADYRAATDRNKFWRMQSGDVMNILDEAIARIEELEAARKPNPTPRRKEGRMTTTETVTRLRAECDRRRRVFTAMIAFATTPVPSVEREETFFEELETALAQLEERIRFDNDLADLLGDTE